MCLIIKTCQKSTRKSTNIRRYILTAKSDITCYKIVRKNKFRYETPFQDTVIRWPVMRGIIRFRAKGTKMENNGWGTGDEMYVYDGVIHTMVNPDEAKEFLKYIRDEEERIRLHPDNYEIWECVIPRGNKYLVGNDANGYSCLGSRSIRFKKKFKYDSLEIQHQEK